MTIARREFIFGGLALGALATAEFLRPRIAMDLVGSEDVNDIVPENLGPWQSVKDASLVQPVREGSLVDELYDGLLTRRYVNQTNGAQIMLLIAHGRSQTDALQLHRPEACYPAVGIPIASKQDTVLPLAQKQIPAVALTAQSPSRTEDIIYWTRMGEQFPQSASIQRSEKLKLALRGLIPDGMLVRISQIRVGEEADFDTLRDFAAIMVNTIKPEQRAALIGTVA